MAVHSDNANARWANCVNSSLVECRSTKTYLGNRGWRHTQLMRTEAD
ncbi:hypothetical protein EMGBS8_18930 [Verrucomicrobiota bacterium]|nr:hypothetical protein EMGBS8_18930 [Verrucomicrobiota bacterium]